MEPVTCPKCGELRDTIYCPADGSQLREDPLVTLIEDVKSDLKQGRAYLEKNATSESDKVQKSLPARRATLDRKQRQLEYLTKLLYHDPTEPEGGNVDEGAGGEAQEVRRVEPAV